MQPPLPPLYFLTLCFLVLILTLCLLSVLMKLTNSLPPSNQKHLLLTSFLPPLLNPARLSLLSSSLLLPTCLSLREFSLPCSRLPQLLHSSRNLVLKLILHLTTDLSPTLTISLNYLNAFSLPVCNLMFLTLLTLTTFSQRTGLFTQLKLHSFLASTTYIMPLIIVNLLFSSHSTLVLLLTP